MRWRILIAMMFPVLLHAQTTFSLSGYTANRTFTNNNYTYTNTQNGYTLSVRVMHNANPGYINITGATSPNYATYAPSGCSSISGLFLASNRSSLTPVISTELSFSPAVCGPVTFRLYDINGEDVNVSLGYGFRDDVTVTAYDQDNVQIPLSTAMVTNNGSGNCGGGSYGASYVHTVGNSLKLVGCTYDNCAWDYFTISSATKMISRIVIDYASGNRDWYGTSITNPNWQWIILNDIRAWTPALNILPNCGSNPVQLNGSVTQPFPPLASSWGVPAGYPALPSANRPSSVTYSWSGSGVTFTPPNTLSTLASGLSDGSNVTLTVQNNRGCVVSRQLGLTTSNCSVLPVELTAFDGHCADGMRVFEWTTASEYNNDHFRLEQSADAILFESVAYVTGAGSSQTPRQYRQEIPGGGGTYFRLAQYDTDGTVSYSRVIRVACAGKNELSIYPNPAGPVLSLNWNGDDPGRLLQLQVYDVLGRTVRNLPLGSGISQFDIGELASGVYVCKLRDQLSGELFAEGKFVKE